MARFNPTAVPGDALTLITLAWLTALGLGLAWLVARLG
jgi:hypothetical protein